MRILRMAIKEALLGRGRLLLIEGEAGIGKSRLADEAATYASREAVRVCWGRCWEGEGSPTLWPWIQVVRSCVDWARGSTMTPPHGLANAQDLLAQLGFTEVQTLPLIPREVRFRQFDLFITALKSVSASQPLMIILDDIHWADTASLSLLEFALSELRSLPVLILGLHRAVARKCETPGMKVLRKLPRHTSVQKLRLGGLSKDAIRLFINAYVAEQLSSDALTLVSEVTHGSPLYLKEILGKITAAGTYEALTKSPSAQPDRTGICDVIGRQLDRLGPDCKSVLRIAAVVGCQFDVALLAKAAGKSVMAIIETLEEALGTGIVQESKPTGRYHFTLGLMRDVLYNGLSQMERVGLHAQVGEALEHLHGASPVALEQLAFHFSRSAVGGNGLKAVDYLVGAARNALDLYRYEQAISYYETALRIAESCEVNTEAHCEMLLGLGEAQKRAGDAANARVTFRRAANLARSVRLRNQFASAALGVAGPLTAPANPDQAAVCLLEEACEMLEGEESALRVQVLGSLAVALYFSQTTQRCKALADLALQIARRIADCSAQAFALSACHHVALGSEDIDRRLAIAEEIVDLAVQCQSGELSMRGHHFRGLDLLEIGRPAAAMAEVQMFGGLARELDHPGYRYLETVMRGALALMYCHWDEAEALAMEARGYGIATGDPRAEQYFGVQMCLLRWEQGRIGELEAAVEEFIVRFPAVPAWRAVLAFVWGSTGKPYQASKLLDVLTKESAEHLPKDGLWLTAMCLLAETAHSLRHHVHSRNLASILAPYAARVLVVGVGAGCLGAVGYFLGSLATVTASWGDGEVVFREGAGNKPIPKSTISNSANRISIWRVPIRAQLGWGS